MPSFSAAWSKFENRDFSVHLLSPSPPSSLSEHWAEPSATSLIGHESAFTFTFMSPAACWLLVTILHKSCPSSSSFQSSSSKNMFSRRLWKQRIHTVHLLLTWPAQQWRPTEFILRFSTHHSLLRPTKAGNGKLIPRFCCLSKSISNYQ